MRMRTGLALLFLVLALALPSMAQVAQPFADVPPDHWAAKAVAEMAAAGIMEGRPNGQFDGRAPMSRYEVAVSLARLLARVEKMIPAGGTPGTPGATLEQIRQMILTDAAVQQRLRGAQGERGLPGASGAAATVDQLRDLILANPDVQAKLRGPQGAQGQQGLQGVPGAKGDPGLTPAQLAALTKLLNEFGPEIAAIRGDIRTLADRVGAVEVAVTKIPPLRASITGGIRAGLQGTSLEFGQDAAVTADNTAIFNSPFVDPTLDKDLLKGARFAVSLFDLNIDGALNDGLAAHATLRAITPVAFDTAPYAAGGTVVPFDATQDYAALAGAPLAGIATYADSVQLWDWYATMSTGILGKDISLTAGRHSNAIAQGLLVDTSRNPLLGLSADTGFGAVNVGVNFSLIDRVGNPLTIDPASVQDSMAYVYAGFSAFNWNFVGTWLQSGFAEQRGWGIATDGSLFGIHTFGEYATLTRTATGIDPTSANDSGWMVGADLINNWKGFSLTGRYGAIDAGFNPVFSALYPYAAVNAYDINWIDRPLFLDPNNVTQGWEADMRLALSKSWTLSSRVYGGNFQAVGAAKVDADTVWTIMLKKQLANGVAASVLYGQREVTNRATGLPHNDDLTVLRGALEFML
jgi:hypothetical protein